jgi:hypothetical protein
MARKTTTTVTVAPSAVLDAAAMDANNLAAELESPAMQAELAAAQAEHAAQLQAAGIDPATVDAPDLDLEPEPDPEPEPEPEQDATPEPDGPQLGGVPADLIEGMGLCFEVYQAKREEERLEADIDRLRAEYRAARWRLQSDLTAAMVGCGLTPYNWRDPSGRATLHKGVGVFMGEIIAPWKDQTAELLRDKVAQLAAAQAKTAEVLQRLQDLMQPNQPPQGQN